MTEKPTHTRPKIEEEMWCYHCEKEWITDDYFGCKQCPNCTTTPVKIYRTSSMAWVYAYLRKHPEKDPQHPDYKPVTMDIIIEPKIIHIKDHQKINNTP